MRWIVSLNTEPRRVITIKELENRHRVKLNFKPFEVEAEDRWGAVIKAHLRLKETEAFKMQDCFDVFSVRKAEKRYEKGWKQIG